MNRFIQSMASLLSIAIVTGYGMLLQQNPLQWSALVAILLISLLMVWVHRTWWTRARYVLCVSVLIVLTLLLTHFNSWNPYGSMLLLPLVLVLARDVEPYGRLTAILAAIAGAAMLAITYPSDLAFPFLPWVIASYFSVRGINKYKEIYRVSQLRLQELHQAHRALKQTHEALQESTVHSMRYAALAERTRLARDMHDGLGHRLTSLIVQIQALEIMLPNDPQQAATMLPTMLDDARKAMSEVRLAVREWNEDESRLGPVALQGLVSQTAANSSLTLDFQQDNDLSDWSLETSTALYHILQEALTNIMRHAQATAASIEVREVQQFITMTIADNGHYTDAMGISPGFGLQGIMERCEHSGGTCAFSQHQPHGLKIQVTLPAQAAQNGDTLTFGSRHIPLSISLAGRQGSHE